MIFFSSGSAKFIQYSNKKLNVHYLKKIPNSVSEIAVTDADLLQAALDQSVLRNFRAFDPVGKAHLKLSSYQGAEEVWVKIPHSRDFMYAIEVLEASSSGLAPPLHTAVKDGCLELVRFYLEGTHAIQMSILGGDTPLMLAVRGEHASIVDALLQAGADSNARHDRGLTPVMQAAEMGNADLIRLLVARGADVNAIDATGMPALIFATRHGHLDSVRALLDAKADVNATLRPVGDGRSLTPLLVAAKNGHVDIVKALLDAHADRTAVDTEGTTALMFAVKGKDIQTVNLLLQSENNVNGYNQIGDTALIMAARTGNLDVINALLHAKARVDMCNRYDGTALSNSSDMKVRAVLKEAEADLARIIGNGSMVEVAILSAAAAGNIDAVDASMLAVNGAGAAGGNGSISNSVAAHFGHMTIVGEMLESMRPEKGTHIARHDGGVRAAIERGDVGYLEVMVRFGSLFINDYLLIAIRDGKVDHIDTLLHAGANANFEFAWKTTVLMLAAHSGQVDIVKKLLAAGANANAISEEGHAVLLYAVDSGNVEIAEILINAQVGIEIERGNKTGLLVSRPADHEAMEQKLLQAKVDTAGLNEFWKAVQASAHQHGHAEIVKMLTVARENIGFPVEEDACLQALAQESERVLAGQVQLQPTLAAQNPDAAAASGSLSSGADHPMDGSGGSGAGNVLGHLTSATVPAQETFLLDAAPTHAFRWEDYAAFANHSASSSFPALSQAAAAGAHAMDEDHGAQALAPSLAESNAYQREQGEQMYVALQPSCLEHDAFL